MANSPNSEFQTPLSSSPPPSPPPSPPSSPIHSTSDEDSAPSSPTIDQLFSQPDGDLILRSVDGVEFLVHRFILCKASKRLHELVNYCAFDTLSHSRKNMTISVLRMEEDEVTIRILLGFLYPQAFRPLQDLTSIKIALLVNRSFKLGHGIRDALKCKLLEFAPKEPERVYCIAWTNGLQDVVLAAAREALRMPWPPACGPRVEEYGDVNGLAVIQLQDHYRAVLQKVGDLVRSPSSWITIRDVKSPIIPGSFNCPICPREPFCFKSISDGAEYFQTDVARWWTTYLSLAEQALSKAPHPSTVKDWALMAPAIISASRCSCGDGVEDALKEFSELFAEKIERIIANTTLVVNII